MKAEPLKVEPVKAEPVLGAGFDPAFVPGITGPTPTEAGPVSKEPSGPEATEEALGEASGETGAETPEESAEEPPGAGDGDGPDSDEPDSDGPVFEAADRRARIVADRRGVRLSLDEEACDFRWDEIAAVETETPRFGKRYTVTVHTPDRRWFPIEIEAPARARFKEWDEQLDAVLDAYFEEA
ncbi:hypothetical protein QWJ26_37745 [Streptomyces sp. CSDS2]|uniref:hypothetical protein n=1 Tax=Streptomyces sp. CSDS2 TaxID=3055051 RepID=UPI0025AFA7FB|nr:hypothetical protein [Streptomyces sp. CSDS2]MDN3265451.1 hypothetical protein [Streptomyces sp. CSDS2]